VFVHEGIMVVYSHWNLCVKINSLTGLTFPLTICISYVETILSLHRASMSSVQGLKFLCEVSALYTGAGLPVELESDFAQVELHFKNHQSLRLWVPVDQK